MSTINLTPKEQVMLGAVISEMGGIPIVDFNKVAEKTGHAYSRNARSAFVKIWEKLKAGAVDSGASPAESGDGDGVEKLHKRKSAGDKGTGLKKGIKRVRKERAVQPKKKEDGELVKLKKLEQDDSEEDGKSRSLVRHNASSPQQENDEWWDAGENNDYEQDAAAMGLSVEAYRVAIERAPTPCGVEFPDEA